MNVDFYKAGEWTMLILGEVCLHILIVDIQ
jgi:hypothetical protein